MTPDKVNRLWLLATFILILLILITSLAIWLGRDRGREIYFPTQNSQGINPEYVVINGAVANPGAYPFKQGDTVNNLLKAAGGLNQNADPSSIMIFVPQIEGGATPQKIDINRAEAWLLQALPGIGEVRAQAIINYRSQNNPFKNIEEIMLVPGLNESTFEKIKGLITISENLQD